MQEKIGHILILTIDFPPTGGGMSRHCYDVAASLKEQGEHPVVLTCQADEDFGVDAPCEVIRLKSIKHSSVFDNYIGSVFAYFSGAVSYCRKQKVKAIIANTWTIAGVAAFLTRMCTGIPFFVFAHGLDICSAEGSKKASFLMKRVLTAAGKIFTNSDFTKSLLKKSIKHNRIEVVYPVVDVSRFASAPDTIVRNPGKKIILTVARLVKSKGQEIVIRALPRVLENCPGLVYQIVGSGPDEASLKALAGRLSVSDHVVFLNSITEEQLTGLYAQADVFIMVSQPIQEEGQVEGFGIVFLEAASCGKPVIGSKAGGIPEAIIDGATGILVGPSNVDETAQALLKLLSDPELCKKYGEAGKKRAVSDFNRETMGGKIKANINGHLDRKT